MDEETRIMELVEAVLESGGSPEEACREFPGLLTAVRNRLERFRSVDAHLGDMFPPFESPDVVSPAILHRAARAIPNIPGYEVQEMVGAGGMGVVYRARQVRLSRIVAIKMLLAGDYAGERDLERFKREAESIAALCHPNIVQVYDADERDGHPYFVMEFMAGGSLSHALKGTPLPAKRAAETATVLARAVHAAHASGIIHRDLKPGNVLLTSDGTLKIADFGLADRLGAYEGATVVRESARLGTPSYMAPEQALASGIVSTPISQCPHIDIYGLGAILYEMLTGRPPFRGETAAETERQVIHDEPVAPSKLNPRTPRIWRRSASSACRRPPERRYETAAALADDLDRFLRGEPITARPVGRAERCVRWVRRNPTEAALLLSLISLVGLALGYAAREWVLASKRQVERARLTARLESGVHLEQQGRFAEGGAILRELGDAGFEDLRGRIDQAVAEITLAQTLDGIRDGRQAIVNGHFDLLANFTRADKVYEAAFKEAGFGGVLDEPAGVAALIAQSPIRAALVAALDDWSVCSADDARTRWVMEVARRADPDPSGWRDHARQPGLSREALADLAATAVVPDQSPQLLLALGLRMRTAGADVVPFLDSVQRQYPGDFSASYSLGEALFDNKPPEAIRYYQAALTSHPGSILGHYSVGRGLANAERSDESIVHFREALRREPTFVEAMSHLGCILALRGRGEEGLKYANEAVTRAGSADALGALGATLEALERNDEAIAAYRRSIAVDPEYFWGHFAMAKLLGAAGRTDDCMAELECSRRLKPDSGAVHVTIAEQLRKAGRIDDAMAELNIATRVDALVWRASAHAGLGECWRAKGSPQMALMEYDQSILLNPAELTTQRSRHEIMVQLGLGMAARADWKRALEETPLLHESWNGYPELCACLDDQDAYEKACHEMLDLLGSSSDPRICERAGRACLLGVTPAADTSRAVAMIERAVASLSSARDWKRPYFLVAQGLAQYRQKNFDGVIDSIGEDSQKVLGPLPHLVLAMAHQRAGRRTEALRSFARGVRTFDWDPSHASEPDHWMYHAVRREAERLVLPNLDALLAGRDSPGDQDERLALLAVCESTQRYAMAAALYAEAFDADPGLADHPDTGRHYSAACCAARAGRWGGGDGRDAAGLSEEQRARLRRQARKWLQSDLDSWSAGLTAGTKDPHLVVQALSHWRADPDLASLRDPELLAPLAPEERDECLAIWSAVDAVIGRASFGGSPE